MRSTSVHRRLARAAAAFATIGLLASAGQAAAAPYQAAVPVVSVSGTNGSAVQVTDCRGSFEVHATSPLHVVLTRTGDTTSPLTVNLQYGGPLASSSGLPTQATFPAGAAEVDLVAAEATEGTISIEVLAGDGYALDFGNVAILGIDVVVADLGCWLGDVSTTQTIEVGTAPAPIDVVDVAGGPSADLIRTVEGTAPPGTTYHPDGSWEGVATEVGRYELHEFFCDEEGWCPYRADIGVIVVPATDVPTTTTTTTVPRAIPANAVAGTADYTG